MARLGDLLTPRDALLHESPTDDPTWLESNWFSFIVPEAHMRGHINAYFRSNLGVVMSTIQIWSSETQSLLDLDYWDQQFHLPMPAGDLDDYELTNGLAVKMHEPLQRWTVDYAGFADTRIRLEFTGLMPAIDSRETRLPQGKDFSHFHQLDAAVTSGIGHIDQTQAVKGEVTIRGKTYEVDFPSNHDHSWSPRPERAHGRGYFDEGYFGNGDFCFHVQTASESAEEAEVSNGYIVDRGEVLRLKAGVGRYKVDGWNTTRLEYEVEDERGRTHRFIGEPKTTTVLRSWPNQYNIGALVKWTYDGEEGWGEYKWHWEVTDMLIAREAGSVA